MYSTVVVGRMFSLFVDVLRCCCLHLRLGLLFVLRSHHSHEATKLPYPFFWTFLFPPWRVMASTAAWIAPRRPATRLFSSLPEHMFARTLKHSACTSTSSRYCESVKTAITSRASPESSHLRTRRTTCSEPMTRRRVSISDAEDRSSHPRHFFSCHPIGEIFRHHASTRGRDDDAR